MARHVLIIGGTRFIGPPTVEAFLDAGYTVTIFTRGNTENPLESHDDVDHVVGDRTNDAELRRVQQDVTPDVVIDCVAYYPRDVYTATDVFADVDAYVYISSGAAYHEETIPKREDETKLESCSSDQAVDDSWETYGARKAEGDRAVFAAADRGVNAMAVRPPIVYGPNDYTERFDYWIDRVDSYDRIVVPGDGTNLRQLAYVEDVASALRIVAEDGTPGEAYNVGDDHVPVLGEWVDRIATACDTSVDVVTASARELETVDLALDVFPLYRSYPYLLETAKLRSLGWTSTPQDRALEATVADHRQSDRTGREHGPERAVEERLIEILGTIE